jgi:hypothetical protein
MKSLVIMTAFLFSFSSFAWGPKGQQITVMIAERYLTASAKEKIMKVTGNKPLSFFATWADQARNTNEWNDTGSWHYIDVEDEGRIAQPSPLNAPTDVLSALEYCSRNLQSETDVSKKLTWLKFIVHLVGDLHQPMHVGRPEDRGGNLIKVMYGKLINLHALWDSAFIDKKGLSIEDYSKLLISQGRNQEALKNPFNAETVIEENLKFREFLYSYKDDKIDSTYEAKAFVITDDRLWFGGLRLASLLNSLFK